MRYFQQRPLRPSPRIIPRIPREDVAQTRLCRWYRELSYSITTVISHMHDNTLRYRITHDNDAFGVKLPICLLTYSYIKSCDPHGARTCQTTHQPVSTTAEGSNATHS